LLGGVEGAPDFLAGVFIERDGVASLAADDANELLAVEERVVGVAPQRGLRAVVGWQVFRPDDVAGGGVETFTLSAATRSMT
jgi:hypothetical protein